METLMTEQQQIELNNVVNEELEILVNEVLNRHDRIIPVIGDDCFVGLVGDDDKNQKQVPLQEWIIDAILKDKDVAPDEKKKFSAGYIGLDLLFDKFKNLNPDKIKDRINLSVDDGVMNKKVFLRRDVKDFLIAGKFDVIATTCPYHILEKEISTTDRKYNVSSFSPVSFKVSSKGYSKSEEVLSLPAIYQIFGDCLGEYVSGEDDLLKFLHYLNQTDTEKGYGASPLVKYIKDKGHDNKGLGLLMPIGCNNLPNWLFRFLWYPFSQERIIGSDRNNKGGVWHKHSSDDSFHKFLINYKFKTFSTSTELLKEDKYDGDPVLRILTTKFNDINRRTRGDLQKYASNELDVKWENNDEWDFFISYASEDADIATRIHDLLAVRCGKRVWMDNRGGTKPGENYWKAIQHGIEHSLRYVFIFTDNYLEKAINQYHNYGYVEEPTGVFEEIERIKRYLRENSHVRINNTFPIIIKGTKVTYTDRDNIVHKNEHLTNAVLDKLDYNGVLRTYPLFIHLKDIICNLDDLEDELFEVFNMI
jgi:hypothetical protein